MSLSIPKVELCCPICGDDSVVFEAPGSKCQLHDVFLVSRQCFLLDPSDGHLGQLLANQYLIFGRVGQGGMGSVYKAVHLKLGRIVAIKMIRSSENESAQVEQLKARFLFEAQSLSRLSHRNIVGVFDYGEVEGALYLVLELISGLPLSKVLREKKRMGLNEVIPILTQLLSAVEVLHNAGFVHRDIKPSNLILEDIEPLPRVVLIDFGVAKAKNERTGDFERELTQMGMAVGTPRYMSPEVLQGGQLGPWTDLYAVGVILYQMLVGSPPYEGNSSQVIAGHLRDPIPLLPRDLDLDFVNPIVRQALAKDPTKRFSKAFDFKEALKQLGQEYLVRSERLDTQVISTALLTQTAALEKPLIKTDPTDQPSELTPLNTPSHGLAASNKFSNVVTEPHEFGNLMAVGESSTNKEGFVSIIFAAIFVALVLAFFVIPERPTNDTELTSLEVKGENQSTDLAVVKVESPTLVTGLPLNQTESKQKTDSPETGLKTETSNIDASRSTDLLSAEAQSETTKQGTGSPVVTKPNPRPQPTPRPNPRPQPTPRPKPPEKDTLTAPDITSVLLRRFEQQLQNCQCEDSRVTIGRLESLISKRKLEELNGRRDAACNVLGERCSLR